MASNLVFNFRKFRINKLLHSVNMYFTVLVYNSVYGIPLCVVPMGMWCDLIVT